MFKQESLEKIYYILKTNKIKSLIVIFILTILASLFELIGVGLIVPLLNVFVKNEVPDYLNFISSLGIKGQNQILITILSFFILIQFLRFAVSFLLLVKKSNFNWILNDNLSKKILSNYLKKDILFF